ncbi:MAG TPA: hypothetical protein P5232_00840 [Candidatus Moranbacteria bacterium]|nr:hypothetical protein [Candidatus Moranbacteria bacterium]
MGDNYWIATDQIKKRLGGKNPKCPTCGGEMFPQDDHGRFTCFSCPGRPDTNLASFSRLSLKKGKLGIQKPGETEKP